MRKNVVKKVTAVSLAATLAFGSLISAFADLGITGGANTYGVATAAVTPSSAPSTAPTPGNPGIVVDGTNGWNSQGAGLQEIRDNYSTNVTFINEPFLRDQDNWSNFVMETNQVGNVKGVTMRADAYSWVYGDDATVVPTVKVETSWGDDWAAFREACVGEVVLSVYKLNTKTLKFDIKFKNDLTESYTITYPTAIPAGLGFYVGADGARITITDISYSEKKMEADPTTKPTVKPTTKPDVVKPVAPAKLTVKETAGYDKATSYTLVKGKKVTIATSISPAKASQKIKATVKGKVVTAKVKGNKVTITAKKPGTAKVTIASTAKASVKKVVTVKVVKKAVKAKKVTVKKATLSIKRGKTGQINIKKITPANTTDKVTYKVTKKLKGVSVDKFGKVKVTKKAKKGKKATVTVKVGKKASKKVTIKVK